MQLFQCPVRPDSPAVLTGYLHEIAPEMPHRTLRPSMLVLPGGGYHYCSEREAEPIAMVWYARGYNVFVLRYTVITETRPAPLYLLPLQDAAAAMALLRAKAEEWRLAPDKIAVIGFSAGGHLATSLGVHWDDERLGAADARPNALLLGYPVVSSRAKVGYGSIYVVEKLTAGEADWVHYFALEKQVRPDMPPAFIWATGTDHCVNANHSLRLATAMVQAGVPCELHLFGWGEHGYSLAGGETASPTLPADAHIAAWDTLAAQWLNTLFHWEA